MAPSTADLRELHARHTSIALLLVGLKYAVDASLHFVDPGVARYLDAVGIGLAVIAVLLILRMFAGKIRAGRGSLRLSPDDFITDTMLRASKVSWITSFFLLVALEVVSKDFTELAAPLFLQVVLAVMLCTQGIAFLLMNRDDAASDALTHA